MTSVGAPERKQPNHAPKEVSMEKLKYKEKCTCMATPNLFIRSVIPNRFGKKCTFAICCQDCGGLVGTAPGHYSKYSQGFVLKHPERFSILNAKEYSEMNGKNYDDVNFIVRIFRYFKRRNELLDRGFYRSMTGAFVCCHGMVRIYPVQLYYMPDEEFAHITTRI